MEKLQEDMHFYIDNAPPEEVKYVLRILNLDEGLTTKEIAEKLKSTIGFHMQKDTSYSPRRLYDLGLAEQYREKGKPGVVYKLTALGSRMQFLQETDEDLVNDLLHYLHYIGYTGHQKDRKLFWSYRRCCEVLWETGKALSPKELASIIQEDMRTEFPNLDFSSKQGARFNSSGATAMLSWIRALTLSPIEKGQENILYRKLNRYELSLLALEALYKKYNYSYGDPLLLDDQLISEISSVFFLDKECCSTHLNTASKITSYIKFSSTLAGTSISLLRPVKLGDF